MEGMRMYELEIQKLRTKGVETNNMVEMKKSAQCTRKKAGVKKKTALALFLSVCMLSMSGCIGSTDSSSDGSSTTGEVPVLARVDYDEMFTGPNGERQKTDGKYATVTKDGLVRWDQENKQYEQTPQVMEMMKKVTVDGIPVSLPMQFEDITKINPDYKKLTSINCKKIIKDGGMEDIEDKKTGYYFGNMTGIDEYKEDKSIFLHIYTPNITTLVLHIDLIREHIEGLDNIGFRSLCQSDIRVDGIGRGNTFNEMYEKFGIPYEVADIESLGVCVTYYYENRKEDKAYIIRFMNDDLLMNPKSGKEEEVQKNMIHSVDVVVMEQQL